MPQPFGLVVVVIASFSVAMQNTPPAPVASCREWHECQRLALEANAQGDYERFHDLAWRTVQTGPARDPELMFLLARAQSLSNRPHDALVMLGRLAELGFVRDVAADADFRAVRQLRQWPELEAAITAVRAAATASTPIAAVPAAATVSTPIAAVPAAAPVSTPVAAVARHAEEALRIPATVLGSAGLAYDRVSSRFVVADAGLRKLVIIDERSHHLLDLVTSTSAGFFEITGFEIDPSRGDLWVVSAESAGTAADGSPATALHKLQLVAGRPLDRIPVPVALQPCRLVDVAVLPDGSVIVLDALGGRLLRFRSATRTFTPIATLHLQSPTSVAAAGGRAVYVAHSSGIARVDTVTGAVESLQSSSDVALVRFERIRWALDSLLGVQRLSDGSQRAVRIRLVAGRATATDVLESGLSAADRVMATVSGNEFYFLVQSTGDPGDLVFRRSRLR